MENDTCFFEEDIERVHVATVATVAEIDDVIKELGVEPGALEAPWNNDFLL
ncbi:hypothetical protein [Streptomyces niveus]|uniref:hypothetical protein n=1 Tax=Streptomyces niveus TaxID=193462 RepID=UPI0035DCD78B